MTHWSLIECLGTGLALPGAGEPPRGVEKLPFEPGGPPRQDPRLFQTSAQDRRRAGGQVFEFQTYRTFAPSGPFAPPAPPLCPPPTPRPPLPRTEVMSSRQVVKNEKRVSFRPKLGVIDNATFSLCISPSSMGSAPRSSQWHRDRDRRREKNRGPGCQRGDSPGPR